MKLVHSYKNVQVQHVLLIRDGGSILWLEMELSRRNYDMLKTIKWWKIYSKKARTYTLRVDLKS